MARPIVAVDVGNSRIKLGFFADVPPSGCPEPSVTAGFDAKGPIELSEFTLPSVELTDSEWWIASVNRPAAARILEAIGRAYPAATVQEMDHTRLPITINVEHPQRVGLDRLAAAVAANRLRSPSEPAVTIHVGSAITVNWTSAVGVFEGGAILPGIGMSAKAMHSFTDQLPLLEVNDLQDIHLANRPSEQFELYSAPAPLGKSTVAAMQAGLFWGAIGAIRELFARLERDAGARASIYLTGGAAPLIADLLADEQSRPVAGRKLGQTRITHVPHLVLSGIAIAAASQVSDS